VLCIQLEKKNVAEDNVLIWWLTAQVLALCHSEAEARGEPSLAGANAAAMQLGRHCATTGLNVRG